MREPCGVLVYIMAVLMLLVVHTMGKSPQTSPEVLQFLQKESSALSSAQTNVGGFLKSRGIRLGIKASERALPASAKKAEGVRIALSTPDNNLECRVSLSRAAIGSKVIAPCRCSGSQEWVQFSELNRLRRRDPKQWTVCPTCQTRFDFGIVHEYGGVQGNLVSTLLDRPVLVRSAVGALLALAGVLLRGDLLVMRLLTSKLLWSYYPNWSKLVHLPLVLKYWGGKIALTYVFQGYLMLENGLLEQLTDLETALVEPELPVNQGQDEGREA